MSERFAHGKNLSVSSPTLPSFPSEVCCPYGGSEWGCPTGSCSTGSGRGKHIEESRIPARAALEHCKGDKGVLSPGQELSVSCKKECQSR